MDIKQNIDPAKNLRKQLVTDVLIIIGSCIIVYIVASKYDILENIVAFSHKHEDLEFDEIITVAIFLMFALVLFSLRRLKEIKISKTILSEQNVLLQKAVEEIKQLEGIIPICASCKKIRNDTGFWQQVEEYVGTRTKCEFSHGMCPECLDQFYGDEDWYIEMKFKERKDNLK